MCTLTNSEDPDEMQHNAAFPDEMQHNAAFHQGLYCLLKLNRLKGQKHIII